MDNLNTNIDNLLVLLMFKLIKLINYLFKSGMQNDALSISHLMHCRSNIQCIPYQVVVVLLYHTQFHNSGP